jgi:NAD(P)-dependent dehydrogenase (short-subunit alcohol dehydrogenase family)
MGVAVVTGAGQGLGRAIAERLARDGFSIVSVDRNGDGAAATAAATGGEARTCDVRDRAALFGLARELGPIEVLVNNAGIWRYSSVLEASEQDVRDVVEVNLLGTLWGCQAFAPQLVANGGGSIVNLSSTAAFFRATSVGIYSATKLGVEAITSALALELGPRGVRVNAVGPGTVLTEGSTPGFAGERFEQRRRGVPLQRVGAPDEIADVVSFLASHDARYVSGQVLYADGGGTAGRAG